MEEPGSWDAVLLLEKEMMLMSKLKHVTLDFACLKLRFTVTTIQSRSLREPLQPGLADESMTKIDNETIERDIKCLLAEAADSFWKPRRSPLRCTPSLVPAFRPWILNGDSVAVWKIAGWASTEQVVQELLGWLEMLNDEAINCALQQGSNIRNTVSGKWDA
ncbi:unnamed protein product [Orchesella dallaii]|uniref:Uncharacterized protein n=1 Tax=Orchesella dallaii TaxID=48710 RepID=A0ABP1PUY2_9HEXA